MHSTKEDLEGEIGSVKAKFMNGSPLSVDRIRRQIQTFAQYNHRIT